MAKPTKPDRAGLKKLLGKDFDAVEKYVLEQSGRIGPDEIVKRLKRRFPGHEIPVEYWEILIPAPPGAS